MSIDATNEVLLPGMTDDSAYKEGQDKPSLGEPREYQPIIGIPMHVSQGSQGPLFLADAVGAWAIERMQGRVFLIPLWPFPMHNHRYQSLWSLMLSMDGLLLPAGIQDGTHWSTHWKENESQPGPASWSLSWEIAFAQLASYVGMPILAIADGAEKWNVALGGRGMQAVDDAASVVPKNPEQWDQRTVRVRAQSKLATSFQSAPPSSNGEQEPWKLAFMPHQGVEKIAPGLRSCAQSEDMTVVAFERKDPAFGLGILGRLDWGLDQWYGTMIFDEFLRACRSFDLTRKQNNAWEASRETMCTTISHLVAHHQPLLSVVHATPEEKQQSSPQRLELEKTALSPLNGSMGQQERYRQRTHAPTKKELNKIRRQRLKTALK